MKGLMMKGLFVKDYKLLSTGPSAFNTIFVAVVLGMFILTDLSSYDGYSGINLIIAAFLVGIRSYDVCDNGLAYLFTLPVSRKGYVRESYLFSFLSACCSLVIYGIFDRVLTAVLRPDGPIPFTVFLKAMWECFNIVLLMIALLIPFYLFFGAKRRNSYILAAVGVTMIFISYIGSMPLCGVIQKGARFLKTFPVSLLLLAVSYLISVRLMEKKDF